MLNELATTTTTTKAHCFYLSMSTNISYIPASLKDEKQNYVIQKFKTISHKTRTMV